MNEITQDQVFRYGMGWMTDADERRSVEQAREYDPLVRYWFSLLSDEDPEPLPEPMRRAGEAIAARVYPEAVPSRKDSNRRSVFTVEWALAGDTSVTTGPALTPPPDLPLRRVNQATKVLELLEAPEVVPYGVARVTVEVDGKDTFTGLVPFAEAVEGGQPIRKAELWLSEFGIPIGISSQVEAFVVPANDKNLASFPLADVEALRKQYAGNLDALDAIDLLVAQKKREGQK